MKQEPFSCTKQPGYNTKHDSISSEGTSIYCITPANNNTRKGGEKDKEYIILNIAPS